MDKFAARPSSREIIESFASLAVMSETLIQVRPVRFDGEPRQQSGDRRLDVAHQAEIESCSPSKNFGTQVNLCDLGIGRIEMPIGKICSQHQQRIAAEHSVVAGAETDQAGHANIERIVVFDMLLAAERVHDGRFELVGKLHQRLMGPGATPAAE